MGQGGNNTNVLVGGGLLLGAGYLLYTKVLKPDVITPLKAQHYILQLRFDIIAVRFRGDNVELDIYIQNPNSQPMKVGAIVGDVSVVDQGGHSTRLGKIARYTQTTLAPQAETKFMLTVKLKALQLVAYFTSIVQGKVSHQVVMFTGSININGRLYPVKESFRIA